MELLAEGVTGGLGGCVGRSASFPFDTMKVKMATRAAGGGSVATVVKRILEEEGPLGFYRGLPFSAAEAMYQKFLYALLFSTFKRMHRRITGRDAAMLLTVVFGYLSDLLCVPFSMPIEAMVVQLQCAPADASRYDIVRRALFTREGLLTSLKSGRAYVVLSLKPGLEFAIFDRIKSMILKVRKDLKSDLDSLSAFLLGAVARGVATACTYPYARGKALSQAQLAPSAAAAVRHVFKTEGALGLYRGLSMEISRGMTQSAVMFLVMERVRAIVRGWLLGHTA